MKKTFTLLATLLFTVSTFAQIGVKVGTNLANMTFSESDLDNSMKIGMIIGANYRVEMSDNIDLDLSVSFKQSGVKQESSILSTTITESLNLNYIDISPNLSYSVSDAIALSAGPYIAFAMSGNTKSKIDNDGDVTEETNDIKFGDGDEDDGWKAMDFGINIGTTYFVNDMISVNAGYSLGLSNLFYELDGVDSSDQPSAKNNGIYLSVGYTFGG